MDLQNLPWYGQFLVFLALGGILFGLFYFLYYSDNQSTIESLDTQIERISNEIKMAEKKEGQLKLIKEQIKNKEKVLEDLKEVLPEDKEIQQILSKVQAIISGARLRIQNWVTQPDRKKEIYVEVPISISLDGNYHNLAIFFDQLSRLKKIFTVDNLTVNQTSQSMNSTYTINANFIASTYTYREKPAKGGK
ncbi:MAG: type 4a pilus biogenesis protein PilO [Candidatus Omnitrophota bacterium]